MKLIGEFVFSDDLQCYLAEHGHTAESIQRYVERVPVDIEGMLPWLPERVDAFWDIGCGIGGHAAMIYFLRQENPTIHLNDGDGETPRKVGFMPATKGWFDVERSEQFIAENAPDASIVIEGNGPVDLVYSLKSWGHHYPIETYIEAVKERLWLSGRLIIDIRTGTCGVEILEAHGFRQIGEILAKPKRRRLVFDRGT